MANNATEAIGSKGRWMDTKPKTVEIPCKDTGDVPEPSPRSYRKPQLTPYGQLRPNLQLGSPPPPP